MPLPVLWLMLVAGALAPRALAEAGGAEPADRGLERVAQDGAEVARALPRAGRRLALCVGIDGYRGGPPPLKYAVADAKALAGRLKEIGYEGAKPLSDVVLMTDDAPDRLKPTAENLAAEIRAICVAASNPEDTLIITYAGHGAVVGDGTVLLPIDSGLPDRYGRPIANVAIDGVIADALRSAGARKVLLVMDACRTGAVGGKELGLSLATFKLLTDERRSVHLLVACAAGQASREEAKLGHGRLSSVLLEALDVRSGVAFRNDHEPVLSVHDLQEHVFRRFRKEAWDRDQLPVWQGSDSGTFDVAIRTVVEPPRPVSDEDKSLAAVSLGRARQAWREDKVATTIQETTIAVHLDPGNADALALRAAAHYAVGYRKEAARDAGAVVGLSAEQAGALRMLARLAFDAGDWAAVIENTDRVADLLKAHPGRWPSLESGAGSALMAIDRGIANHSRGRSRDAVGDFSRAVDRDDTPPELKAFALYSRALAYGALGDLNNRLADFTRVLEMGGAPDRLVADCLLGRGLTYGRAGERQKEIADYTRLIEMKGAPGDLLAKAHLFRGDAYHDLGEWEKAIGDLTRVIEAKDVPVDLLAEALYQRGLAHRKVGKKREAIADYRAVTEIQGAPPTIVELVRSRKAFLESE